MSVDLSARPFTITGTDTTVRAHSVIVATGATAKRLGLPSEQRFWSAGISACAICDGASAVFKGQELAVVGGGDTATEEAIYLTKYGSHVSVWQMRWGWGAASAGAGRHGRRLRLPALSLAGAPAGAPAHRPGGPPPAPLPQIHLLVRGERMRASKAMQDRVLANPRVTVHLNTEVGGGRVGGWVGANWLWELWAPVAAAVETSGSSPLPPTPALLSPALHPD